MFLLDRKEDGSGGRAGRATRKKIWSAEENFFGPKKAGNAKKSQNAKENCDF